MLRALKKRELQQRVLSRIFTSFPFKPLKTRLFGLRHYFDRKITKTFVSDKINFITIYAKSSESHFLAIHDIHALECGAFNRTS